MGQTNRAASQQEIDLLCQALCTLRSPQEARAFLADVCSPREEVARLLAGGASYLAVGRATGASSTTVSRVSKCLNGEAGGYRTVLARVGE